MDATQVRQLVAAGRFIVTCECGEMFNLGKLALEEAKRRLGYCAVLRRNTHLQVYR